MASDGFRRFWSLLALAALAAPVALAAPRAAGLRAAERPHIVVILADDLGFADLGCYGSEIPTPRLDALAAGGLRFTQFYNTGRCCPTRAALLTGLYPHQVGVGHMLADEGLPGYRGRLDDSCVTVAEALRGAGYFTAMAGKWHVGQRHGVIPSRRGFDRSLHAPAGGFYFANAERTELFLDGERLAADDPRLPSPWYSTDLWTSQGLRFVDEALQQRKPFFLYLAHNAPHFPLQAPATTLADFEGAYLAGWDALRANRLRRQVQLGLVSPRWQPAARPAAVAAWDGLDEAPRKRFDRLMGAYAACVARLDQSVGALVDGLRQRDVLDDTLILFLSDNGGNAESGPQGRSVGDPSRPDSNWFCGESWAWLQNAPFRLYKHYNHEGGIATPLIAHWPAGIAARGELRGQPGHVIDVMATCVDLAAARLPAPADGREATPLEGRSLRPAFDDQPLPRDALFWEHEGHAAVREGSWKLVRLGSEGPWELYDLDADRTEQHDLAERFPQRVQRLQELWNSWAQRTGVVPAPARRPPGSPPPADSPAPARGAAAG
jgi:arylsulfatase